MTLINNPKKCLKYCGMDILKQFSSIRMEPGI